jgi:molecular chaperone DnaJ
MTATRDYYDILGVSRDADDAAIKKAFRRMARELHPDVNTNDPQAEDKFKEAAEAYEVLSDPDRRATYDRYGHEGLRRGGYAPDFESFGSVADIFDAFFGGASPFGGGGAFGDIFGGRSRGGTIQGGDIAVAAEVDLAEAAHGTSVEVSYEAVEMCEHCRGNGAEPGTPIETCSRCGGSGQLQAVSRTPFGQIVQARTCSACQGDGRVPREPCKTCHGRGRTVNRPKVSVDVPAGIADGQRIRIAGRGHAGERGGPPGDLYVLVRVREDPRFIRDGDDLVTAVDVSAPLAALGTTTEVQTLDGPVQLEIPSGVQPHETLIVRGAGMPVLRGRRRGDLRVVVNVVVPRHLSREQRELYGELAGSMTEHNLRSDEGVFGKIKRALGG